MKKYLEKQDINRVVDNLIKVTDAQIDTLCMYASEQKCDDSLSNIRKISIERASYKRLRNALLNEMTGEEI